MDNVQEILIATLSANGFDGLYNEAMSCGCELDNLMPCEYDQSKCEPGYKVECSGEGECDCDPQGPPSWHIQKEKK